MSPGGTTKNQIDHVMIDSRRKHCITDVKSCRGVCGISDHFLVRIQVHLRLSVKWREKKRVTQKFNTEKLKENTNLQNYIETIDKNLKNDNNTEIDQLWGKLEKTIKQAAKDVLGFEERSKPKKWFNDRCRRGLEERDAARIALIKTPNESNRRTLAIKQRNTKKIIRTEKRQWEKSYINDIETNFKSNIKVSYKKTNNLKNGYKPRTTILKEPDGTLITDKGEIAEKFREMFETLLNKTKQTEPADQYTTTVEQMIHEPTTEEIEMAIDMLKNGKAPGEDDITTELLRKSGKTVMKKLEQIIIKTWREEKIPEAWNLSIVCPIYKKGDIMNCNNYRGISLLDTSYKVLSNVLLNKLKPFGDEIVGEYQGGFRRGKSTVDQIHTVKQVMEKCYEYNQELFMLFVDYKQAYDSINRESLWKAMEKLGVPAKITRMIKACIQYSKCRVKFNGQLSKTFMTDTGLKQGDALSPMLFNIALEEVIRKVLKSGIGVKLQEYKTIKLLAYADDIVLLSESERDLQGMTEALMDKSKQMGLTINEGKTKYMILSRKNNRHNNLIVKDMNFELVENFKYLGVELSVSDNNHKEIQNRINSANKCFFGLKTILKSKLVSIKSKLTLYKVMIRPIAIYACETWATTKTDEQKLARFERKVLRQIFGPRRNQNTGEYERRENKEVINMLEDSDIIATMKSKRISWAGHVWRGQEQTIGQVTRWKPKSKRPLGRSRQRWLDRVNKDLEMLGILNGEEIATNRYRWREVVVAAKDLNGLL